MQMWSRHLSTTSVTVTAEAPLLHAENGDVSATVNQKQLSEVPNPGNDLTYIVQTAPGVVMNTDVQAGANFSILGMPGTSYRYTIDGLSDTDNTYNVQLVGSLFLLLGQNQIQEATVVSTGYAGQFGGAAGGNVNYVTKSGGNEFHGNAQYYWNGRVLNAKLPGIPGVMYFACLPRMKEELHRPSAKNVGLQITFRFRLLTLVDSLGVGLCIVLRRKLHQLQRK